MKIALDATYSLDRNLSGVGVYSREILHGLSGRHPEADYWFCYRPHRFLRSFSKRLPARCRRKLLWKTLPTSADLFHGLNQRIDSTRHKRAVSTFHDLFVMTADYSTPDFRERFSGLARAAAERSDLIITVSHSTANQVMALLNIEQARIRVIPHGVRPVPSVASPPEREPMILFVGAIQRRKNIERLVEAFEQLASGWRLVLAGSAGFGAEEALKRIEASPRRSDIQVLGYVSDTLLEELYQRASIFAFPSLDEGFGMPVLDAMAREVPVLTSNISALPEVAGGAAMLVNPLDVTSIAEGLGTLTEDEALRAHFARKGLLRSREFAWEKAVDDTWKVYQELIG